MRLSTSVHLHPGDQIEVVENDGYAFVEITDRGRALPIYCVTAEEFERLAEACDQAAMVVRARLVAERAKPFDLAAVLEREA